jgi:hypothetical protein
MGGYVNTAQIELLPGFQVLEHAPGHTRLIIPSGFDITVKRIGPYVFRQLEDREDLKDIGPFIVKILLLSQLQPPGVEVDHIYEPPDEMPDREAFEKEWMWWHQYRLWNMRRNEISYRRELEKSDLALLNSVYINDGPVQCEDEQWLTNIESRVVMPTSWSERLLLFYQQVVVTTVNTADVIRELAITKEVTMEGLRKAFDSFRRKMERRTGIVADEGTG